MNNLRIRNIFISANPDKIMTEDAINKIKKHAGDMQVVENIEDADIVISIGGDGSFLHASKIALAYDIPIIGINTGTLGYLTEIDLDSIEESMNRIQNGNFYIEKRMLLSSKVNENLISDDNLNDITLSKNSFDVIRFSIYVDGIHINDYTADGIIVSTPTGSTAYNLSAGGPILDPSSESIVVTPISPHTMINKSLVLSEKSDITILLTEIRGADTALIVSDGNKKEARVGDVLSIRRADKYLSILKLNKNSFLETIKCKMIN